MKGWVKRFLVFLTACALTLGVLTVDKQCSRIAGRDGALYPRVARMADGAIEVRALGFVDTVKLTH